METLAPKKVKGFRATIWSHRSTDLNQELEIVHDLRSFPAEFFVASQPSLGVSDSNQRQRLKVRPVMAIFMTPRKDAGAVVTVVAEW
jgi:hypothetical protein